MMACLQDTDEFAVIRVIFIRAEYVNIRFRSLAVYVWMEVQVTLVIRTFELGQDTSFVSDHLVFTEVRLSYRTVMTGNAVTI